MKPFSSSLFQTPEFKEPGLLKALLDAENKIKERDKIIAKQNRIIKAFNGCNTRQNSR